MKSVLSKYFGEYSFNILCVNKLIKHPFEETEKLTIYFNLIISKGNSKFKHNVQ